VVSWRHAAVLLAGLAACRSQQATRGAPEGEVSVVGGRMARHGEAPALGRPDAKVTLVVFTDFTCDDCARGAPIATALSNLYPDGGVQIILRQFPRDGAARLAAEASLAAHAQGRFWPYYDRLFANQHDLSPAALARYAVEVGLDLGEFRRALEERRFASDVDDDLALGRQLGVARTPAAFANGRRISFPFGVDELQIAVAVAAGR
jgi:protein-disulfide isomerase